MSAVLRVEIRQRTHRLWLTIVSLSAALAGYTSWSAGAACAHVKAEGMEWKPNSSAKRPGVGALVLSSYI
jgi:hypothetical protein